MIACISLQIITFLFDSEDFQFMFLVMKNQKRQAVILKNQMQMVLMSTTNQMDLIVHLGGASDLPP